MNITELITKWENIGFLSSTQNKRNLTLACESTKLHLLGDSEKYNQELTTLIYPVVVRIFNKLERDLSTEQIFNLVTRIITAFSIKLITHQTTQIWNNRNPNIDEKDIEAELVKDFCDNFKLD